MRHAIAFAAGVSLLLLSGGGSGCRPRAPGGAGPSRLAVLAGGSGEAEAENFFVQDLRGFRRSLVARGWVVSAAVGNRDGLLPGSVKADNANLARTIEAAVARVKPGDELLLVFHSHGIEREEPWGQRSHSLTSEDRDAAGAEPGFDLDSVEPWLERARARGAKTALVDLSCYSGATHALRGAGCTATLASRRYVSLCSGRPEERLFSSRFFALPEPGTPVDLETHFLKARREDRSSINLPGLSSRPTPAEEGFTSFLVTVDPLDVFEDLKELRPGPRPFAPARLLAEVDSWIGKGATPALRREIAARLARALGIRARLEKLWPALARDYDEPSLLVELERRESLFLAPASLSEMFARLKGPAESRFDGYSAPRRRLMRDLEPRRAELERRLAPALEGFERRRAEFDGLSQELADAADALFAAERELYDAVQGAVPARDSSCREFAL